MTTDSIKWGETYTLSCTFLDADGAPLAIDGTWAAACRVCTGAPGGARVADVPMIITGGGCTGVIDTGDSPYTVGTYYLDVRVTSPEGHDYWSDPIRLTLTSRCTPAS